MIRLETTRTILRPLTIGDCADVQRWSSVPDNVKYMDWGPNTEQETRRFLTDCERNWAAAPVKQFDFGVQLKDTDQLVGACKIYVNDFLRAGEVGWILRKDYWNQGIMTEVAARLLRFGFEELHLHKMFAICFADNDGSRRIMERSGMRREGHYIKSKLLRNVEPETWCDVYNYAILDEEYFNA